MPRSLLHVSLNTFLFRIFFSFYVVVSFCYLVFNVIFFSFDSRVPQFVVGGSAVESDSDDDDDDEW